MSAERTPLGENDLGAEDEARVAVVVDAGEQIGRCVRGVGAPVAEVEGQLLDGESKASVPVGVAVEAVERQVSRIITFDVAI